MLKTILLLVATLIALPFVAFYMDAPLEAHQWQALNTLTLVMACVAIGCFVVSELSRNYSQVDKIWSLIPLFYVWYVAYASGWNPRLLLMAGLVTLWGLRLTYNFARRGAYSWKFWQGEEDYRWAVLRATPLLQGRLRWGLFNLGFISLYQNALIMLFTLPALVAWQGADKPIGLADALVAVLFVAFLVLETVADQQQYDFQTEKYRRIAAGEPLQGDYARGFRSSGLWGWVRHPNYACEQAIWLCFYLFSVTATGRWINWSLAGALLLLLLFQGSSDFSEKISKGKYPEYADYLRRVPRFIPWPRRSAG